MPASLESEVVPALTALSEDEQMFQSSVERFARERIAPVTREMDEQGKLKPAVVQELFSLGLMGIGIPEDFEGQGGTFFQSILAMEELAKVDPATSVVVDVQNTLVNNAIVRWGSEGQKNALLPRLARKVVGAYA